MIDFRKLMASGNGFVPRTQAQALQGYMEGIIGPEYFIFRAVNVHPILEEPWDVQEIDRLLAKTDLDEDSAILLMTIFERMIKVSDKELALFAAESINALEQRFLQRIQALRKELGKAPRADTLRSIVATYLTLGRLSFARPVLRAFYFGEGRRSHEEHRDLLSDPDLDLVPLIRILLEGRDLDAAGREIQAGLALHPGHPGLHILAAEHAFAVGSYRDVACNLSAVYGMEKDPDCAGEAPGETYAELLGFWGAGACRG